jgi:hypothetical protein
MLVTLLTSHKDRSAVKEPAFWNVAFMLSTRETSQKEIAELKAFAPENI